MVMPAVSAQFLSHGECAESTIRHLKGADRGLAPAEAPES